MCVFRNMIVRSGMFIKSLMNTRTMMIDSQVLVDL